MNPLSLLGFLQPVVDKVLSFIPDPQEKAKAQQEILTTMLTAAQTANQQQTDVNVAEAKSGSAFVAGWRPAIGWVCALALAYQYLIRPVLTFGIFLHTGQHVDLPGLDGDLWELMFGMLGIGGLRTMEKFGGVHTRALIRRK